MAAGAEDETGIETERQASTLGDLFPFRNNHKAFTNLDGFVKFPPVILPVAILHCRDCDCRMAFTYLPQHSQALLIVCEIKLQPAHPGKLIFQLPIHIIPVLVVVFQKASEVLLILYNESTDTELR